MTPSKAIRLNCRFCHGGIQALPECFSRHCSLNRKGSPMERIKNYCRECSADHKPGECNGQLIGTQRKILAEVMGVPEQEVVCPLHQYRLGRNPNLSHSMNQKQLEALRQGRKPFQKAGREAVPEGKF